jgi:hypothetical protein
MSVESITAADANAALDSIFTGTQYIQLHTGHPGAAGTSGIASDGTRKPVTWAGAAAGVKATNAIVGPWTGWPASETIAYFSVWSAVSGGTFHGSGAVGNGIIVAGQSLQFDSGALTITSTVAS